MDPWSRGREVTRDVLRSSPKPEKRPIFCHRRGIENFCCLFSTRYTAAPKCVYQTPGRRPPPIPGRFVNTVTTGWVGAPNERAPFRFHGAVVGFVDRCLPRTRHPAASNKHLARFSSARSWPNIGPKIGPGIIFFGVFEKFETFFSEMCAHSERYRNLLAGIFEILNYLWKHSVSIVTGLTTTGTAVKYAVQTRPTLLFLTWVSSTTTTVLVLLAQEDSHNAENDPKPSHPTLRSHLSKVSSIVAGIRQTLRTGSTDNQFQLPAKLLNAPPPPPTTASSKSGFRCSTLMPAMRARVSGGFLWRLEILYRSRSIRSTK